MASSHGIVLQKSDFHRDAEGEPWWTGETPQFKFRPLEEANDGVDLYLAAAQVRDADLRFFSFYKVLEHFAPTVLNLEAHESLRKKLDTPNALSPDGKFIREILQLSKSCDQRRNERDLIKALLLSSVDLVGLNEKLPDFVRLPITHESTRKDLDQYARKLAECICATRNQMAHAKATFQPTGSECPKEHIAQFTKFIECVAGQAVRWYNRLPSHQRVELSD